MRRSRRSSKARSRHRGIRTRGRVCRDGCGEAVHYQHRSGLLVCRTASEEAILDALFWSWGSTRPGSPARVLKDPACVLVGHGAFLFSSAGSSVRNCSSAVRKLCVSSMVPSVAPASRQSRRVPKSSDPCLLPRLDFFLRGCRPGLCTAPSNILVSTAAPCSQRRWGFGLPRWLW